MYRVSLMLLLTITGLSAVPQNGHPVLTEGARLLFNNTKTKLNDAEKNRVFSLLGFKLSADKNQFIDASDTQGEFPFAALAYPVDLNGDGTEELFVLFGNGFTSGMTGSSITLFIKDKATGYQSELGFPGMLPDILGTSSQGFPDLLIGGPGMEYPVWRWNGKHYIFQRSVNDKDYEKLKKTNAEDASKTYTHGIQ